MEHAVPISIRICHLYPRLLSVAGDRGNLLALTRRCAWRGIRSTVTEADVGEVPDFTGLDAVTEGGSTRLMGHIAVACDLGRGGQRRLVGFENHSGRTHLGPGTDPLGQVIAGSGNNGEDGTEGARYREVFATYLHGPVLPKNPWLTDHLISTALLHRYRDAGTLDSLAPLEDQTEADAHAAALRLACPPTGRWRAAMAARPRLWRAGLQQTGAADLAGRYAQPADKGPADKGMARTSR